jgi:hypothetical protein
VACILTDIIASLPAFLSSSLNLTTIEKAFIPHHFFEARLMAGGFSDGWIKAKIGVDATCRAKGLRQDQR